MDNFKYLVMLKVSLALLLLGFILSIHGKRTKYQPGDCVSIFAMPYLNQEGARDVGFLKILKVIDEPKEVEELNDRMNSAWHAPRFYEVGVWKDGAVDMGYFLPTKDLDNFQYAQNFWTNDSNCNKK